MEGCKQLKASCQQNNQTYRLYPISRPKCNLLERGRKENKGRPRGKTGGSAGNGGAANYEQKKETRLTMERGTVKRRKVIVKQTSGKWSEAINSKMNTELTVRTVLSLHRAINRVSKKISTTLIKHQKILQCRASIIMIYESNT